MKKKKKINWEHESNVNSYGNRKSDVTIIGEKIINWGLTEKDKNKWEWMKIEKKYIYIYWEYELTWIAMEIVNENESK